MKYLYSNSDYQSFVNKIHAKMDTLSDDERFQMGPVFDLIFNAELVGGSYEFEITGTQNLLFNNLLEIINEEN